METYVVIIETKNNRTALVSMIKAYTGWAKLTDDAWLVTSYQSASAIRDSLLKIKKPDDRIFVMRSGAIAAWSNVHASSEWIKKNI